MADIAKRPINTFTLGFHGDRAISEHSHAVLASRHIGAKHNILMLDPGDMLGALDQWTKTFGEPLADPAALPTMLLARLTCEHVTVVLAGEGADEVFSGYGNYAIGCMKSASPGRSGRAFATSVSAVRARWRRRGHRLFKAIGEPRSRRYVTIPMIFDRALHSLLSALFLAASAPGRACAVPHAGAQHFDGGALFRQAQALQPPVGPVRLEKWFARYAPGFAPSMCGIGGFFAQQPVALHVGACRGGRSEDLTRITRSCGIGNGCCTRDFRLSIRARSPTSRWQTRPAMSGSSITARCTTGKRPRRI